MYQAIILAGGKGTRLQGVLNDIPKCMAPVNDLPFLEYVLKYLKKQNVSKVIISVGFKSDYIINNIQNIANLDITFVKEENPLGTGGAIKFALSHTNEKNVFVLNGDTLFNVDLIKMYQNHINKNADISISVKNIIKPERFGTVTLSSENRIIDFKEKDKNITEGLINGGIYLLKKDIFDGFEKQIFSMEEDFFKTNTSKLKIQAFESDEPFIDIGIPEDYYKAGIFVKNFDND